MMKSNRGAYRYGREQVLKSKAHDAYRGRAKLPEPARCRDCGAVYRRGRWVWGSGGEAPRPVRCPACARIKDGMPAGYVRLSGAYPEAHRDAILRRLRRCEQAESRAHPLQRIMGVTREGADLVVTTTDMHLARRLGEALEKSFKGDAKYRYAREDNLLRVDWRRD